ncbi:MAG: CCA tRNA nucleotidyltransferase [Planctomycetota bacterium]
MLEPSLETIPRPLSDLAREIATRLGGEGHRAWLVGGAVRDLCLGRVPKDLDIASSATPEVIERLWPRSLGVGRAFGTMVVHDQRGSIEVTTFRSERGYSDGRRPDEVRYGASLEEDAARRDFTCNALYLDPLDGTLEDPMGGVEDLRAGRLRAVGDAQARLAEDGLRLLRMARFVGQLELEPASDLRAAARSEAGRLASIAGERVLQELTRMFDNPGSARSIDVLLGCGLLAGRFTAWQDAGTIASSEAATRALPPAPGVAAALASFFPSGALADRAHAARVDLDALRPPRELLRQVLRLNGVERELGPSPSRAASLRFLRDVEDDRAVEAYTAGAVVRGAVGADWRERLLALAQSVAPSARRPAPLLDGEDLAATNLPRGPLWGRILEELEEAQLEGQVVDHDGARRWLDERVRAFSSEERPGAGGD